MTAAQVFTLRHCIHELRLQDKLQEMIFVLESSVPPEAEFQSDVWNIISWQKVPGRAKIQNLEFSRLQNLELRNFLKVYLLYARVRQLQADKGFGATTARMVYDAVRILDAALGKKPAQKWSNADFQAAERLLEETYSGGTPARLAYTLQQFARWLNIHRELRLSYVSGLKHMPRHGLLGTEEGRVEKLIPFSVIRDLLALNARDDLPLRDRFFINMMVLLVATGLRLNELMTLPVDCVIHQGGIVGLRYFIEKKIDEGVKWIASDFVEAVLAALDFLTTATRPGRAAARTISSKNGMILDWPAIYKDEQARIYFVSLILHEWTSRPRNDLYNPAGVWLERDKKHVDVIGFLARHDGSWKSASKELATTPARLRELYAAQQRILAGCLPFSGRGSANRNRFHCDSRGASLDMILRETNCAIPRALRSTIAVLVKEAQQAQLAGCVFPKPPSNEDLEARFLKRSVPILRTTNGKTLLEPVDALFVIEEYALSIAYSTRAGVCAPVTARMLTSWLAGEARARGTGSHEASVFERYAIPDPRTGKIAKFTTHEVRHWLNTLYQEGGFTQEQIAILNGRNPAQNFIYDNTSRVTRKDRLKEAIRAGSLDGHSTVVYRRIAQLSAQEAEDYLDRRILRSSIMPHGMCTRNLRLAPCPNYLSCFAVTRVEDGQEKRGLCKDLMMPRNDAAVQKHLDDLERQQDYMLTILQPGYPQYQHALDVKAGIREARGENQDAQQPLVPA